MFWFLLLLPFVLGGRSCKKELRQAIFKPKVCGYEYFHRLEKEIDCQKPLWFSDDQQCRTFGAQHAVGVHVYDAFAQKVCSFPGNYSDTLTLFNFQNITEMADIFNFMKYRTADERYTVYAQMLTQPFIVSTPNYDYMNNAWILSYTTGLGQNSPLFYETIDKYLGLAPGGTSTTADLLIDTWAPIFSLLGYVSPADINVAYAGLMTIGSANGHVFQPDFFFIIPKDDWTASFVAFFFVLITDAVNHKKPVNYQKMIEFLYLIIYGPNTKPGIARQWSLNMPLNLIENDECKYAFILRNEYGEMYKIVLTQAQKNLAFTA